MSVQKVLAMDAPMHRQVQGSGWLATATTLLEAIRARAAIHRAARRDARARAEVMSLARRYASSQPEFAKDLYAAAGNDLN